MANYLKKFTLMMDNATNTDVENSLIITSQIATPINLNFVDFIRNNINITNQNTITNIDTSIFINIQNQHLNICIIKDIPNEMALYRQNGALIQNVIDGRASATFMVYNTQTCFGAYTQHQQSLKLHEINQIVSRLIRHNGFTCNNQEVFAHVLNYTDAQIYIRQSMQQIKKVIIELNPDQAHFNFDDCEILLGQRPRYIQEIDLSIFDDDIIGFIRYLTERNWWQNISKIYGRTDQGKDRMISLDDQVKTMADSFNNENCIIELSNLAQGNNQLIGFQNMEIFNNLRIMSLNNGG